MQELLLFGTETWAVIPRIGWTIKGLHHSVDRRMTGDSTEKNEVGATGIPSPGGCYVDRGPRGSVDVCPPPPEHDFSIYRELSNIEAVSGGRLESGIVGHM